MAVASSRSLLGQDAPVTFQRTPKFNVDKPLGCLDHADKAQYRDRANGGCDQRPNPVGRFHSQQPEQESTDKCAKDSQDDVSDQAKPSTFHELPCQPNRQGTDQQPEQKFHFGLQLEEGNRAKPGPKPDRFFHGWSAITQIHERIVQTGGQMPATNPLLGIMSSTCEPGHDRDRGDNPEGKEILNVNVNEATEWRQSDCSGSGLGSASPESSHVACREINKVIGIHALTRVTD